MRAAQQHLQEEAKSIPLAAMNDKTLIAARFVTQKRRQSDRKQKNKLQRDKEHLQGSSGWGLADRKADR